MRRLTSNPIYWVIATLCVALLPQLASMPAHLVPLTLVPVAWRLLAEWRGWKPLHFALRIAITVVTSYALVVTYGSLIGRRAAVSLLALMLALKLLETFKVRDARVVASLSLFLCATQFLFTQGMLMIAYGGACVIITLVTLTLLHRKQAFEPAGKRPAAGPNMLGELRFTARLLALALPVTLVLFLFFPRWGTPMWGVPEQALDSKTGLSDSMSPGSIQGLFMDDSPAFRAEFQGPVPPRNQLYWRGPVFWHFDGKTWQGSFYGRNIAADTRPAVGSSPWYYSVQLEPSERNWYFALDYPAIVPPGVRLTLDYQLYSRKPVTELRVYEMASNPRFVDSPQLKTILRSAALELPDGYDPRTREMMRQWRAETADPQALVDRALRFFFTENFRYTLNPPLLDRNTVDDFLFNTRQGFCEHYASAFTVMMRMAGVPARVVTGYQGGWYNDIGRYILVRQSDAHAWSEVWLEGRGWTRVDPTAAVAPSRIEQNALDALGQRRHALDFGWVRQFRNGFDLMERLWNDWVIRFDAGLQAGLFRPFGIERLESRTLVILLAVLVAAVALALTPLLLRMRYGARGDRDARLWARFRNRLRAAGVELHQALGPMELASVAGGLLAHKAEEIEAIAGMYSRLRYGPVKPDRKTWEKSVREFRA